MLSAKFVLSFEFNNTRLHVKSFLKSFFLLLLRSSKAVFECALEEFSNHSSGCKFDSLLCSSILLKVFHSIPRAKIENWVIYWWPNRLIALNLYDHCKYWNAKRKLQYVPFSIEWKIQLLNLMLYFTLIFSSLWNLPERSIFLRWLRIRVVYDSWIIRILKRNNVKLCALSN